MDCSEFVLLIEISRSMLLVFELFHVCSSITLLRDIFNPIQALRGTGCIATTQVLQGYTNLPSLPNVHQWYILVQIPFKADTLSCLASPMPLHCDYKVRHKSSNAI